MVRLVLLLLLLIAAPVSATPLRIAAAADLKFAMDELVARFGQTQPSPRIEVIYGSSGKFHAQIRQSAPYDLYFSADIAYPQALKADGQAASEVIPYAVGRIVLWSARRNASQMQLTDLTDPAIRRIAIANPRHAPYGQRAEQALRAAGIWKVIEHKLVYGENIAQTAQFVQSGNAEVGIIALSLALQPALADKGGHALIPETLHSPLLQGFLITRRAAGNPAAHAFAEFMQSPSARAVLQRHGFALPGDLRPEHRRASDKLIE